METCFTMRKILIYLHILFLDVCMCKGECVCVTVYLLSWRVEFGAEDQKEWKQDEIKRVAR